MSFMPNIIQFQPRPLAEVLRRPRLLARAAQAGAPGFNRRRELPRLLKCEDLPAPGAALPRLCAEEQRLNAARLDVQAEYDLQRHVLVLIAILVERNLATGLLTFPGTATPARP